MSKHISLGKSSIGEHHTKESFLEYGSINTSGLEVPQDDVEKIKEALNLLGVDIWEISTEGFGGKSIEKSPLLQEWEDRKISDREAHHAEMRKLLEEFNNLPEILGTWKFGSVEVILKRGNAEYKPGYSSSLIGWVHHEINLDGKAYQVWLSEYISKDGKVLRKRFLQNNPGIKEQDAESLLAVLPMILKARTDVTRKYHIK